MALMARGIVGGEMAWPLVVTGMFLALGLILIKSPSPMLIAVGMYLPFSSTSAIFIGGLMAWMLSRSMTARRADDAALTRATNTGVLLSSGFIAGEALMAVVLAFVVLGGSSFGIDRVLPAIAQSTVLGGLVFVLLYYMLVTVPLRASGGDGDSEPLSR